MTKTFYCALILLNIGWFAQGQVIDSIHYPKDSIQSVTNLALSANAVEMPQVIPPTPQSMLFDQYIDYPSVGNSGTTELVIPLFEIKIKGLTIPVDITYRSSGIKYQQYDGDIGAGWVLNPGYRVTRTMYGKPDELYVKPAGDLYQQALEKEEGFWRDRYLASFALIFPDEHAPQMENINGLDGEYDQFRYMLPSGSGHFIITDRTSMHSQILESYNDSISFSIVKNQNNYNDIHGLNIIDGNGFKYHFGTAPDGTQSLETSTGFSSFSGWPLMHIGTPYGETIDFKYRMLPYVSNNVTKKLFTIHDFIDHDMNSSSSRPSSVGEQLLNTGLSYMAFVENIATDKEIIKFIRTEIGDGRTRYCLLDEIQVMRKDDLTLVKKIKFNRIRKTYHWLLESIEIYGNGSEIKQKYQFGYVRQDQSEDNYYADQWGYYKYKSNNPLPFPFLHQELQSDRYLDRLNISDPISNKLNNRAYFEDRITNEHSPDFLSLETVYFPTGGWRTYEYEPNQYRSGTQTITGGGIRVKKITSNDGQNKTLAKIYKYGAGGDGIGVVSNIPTHKWFANDLINMDHVTIGLIIPVDNFNYGLMRQYSTDVIGDVNINTHVNLLYPEVATYEYSETDRKYNGKVIEKYTLHNPYYLIDGAYNFSYNIHSYIPQNGNSGCNVGTYRPAVVSLLDSTIVFKYENNAFHRLTKTEYSYQSTGLKVYKGMKVRQKAYSSYFVNFIEYPYTGSSGYAHHPNTYSTISSFFDYIPYDIYALRNNILKSRKETMYTATGSTIKTINYAYNDVYQNTRTEKNNSDGTFAIEENKYPRDFLSTGIYQTMVERNMIEPIIERKQYVKKNNNNEDFISLIRTNYNSYGTNGGQILPSEIETRDKTQSVSESRIRYHNYDQYGNPTCVSYEGGPMIIYIWGYKGQYPVAKIETASKESSYYTTVTNAITTTDMNKLLGITSNPTDEEVRTIFKGLRDSGTLSGSLITSYTYKPLVGMTSETDPSGRTIFYEYDDFGRLKRIKDGQDKILREYDYHYAQ